MHFLSVSLVNCKVYKKRGIYFFTNYNFLLSDILRAALSFNAFMRQIRLFIPANRLTEDLLLY